MNKLMLNCCKTPICNSCMLSHIKYSDSVVCPYCRHDYVQYNQDYIKFVELDDVIDSNKWTEWWLRHADIFMSL
jgi:hypothetical protein